MSIPSAPGAVIFDLDGTLVDTVGTRVDSWMAVFPRFGIEAEPGFLAPLMGSDGKLLARMTAEHYGVTLPSGEDARIDIAAGEEFRVRNAHPRALPGARDILEWLSARKVSWAVATSSLPADALASVAALGLREEPLVCDGADVEHAKPAPDLLLKAAAQLRIRPPDAWYAGDSQWDMLASAAADMRAIGVLTGATRRTELEQSGADAVYASLADLHRDLRGVVED